MSRTLFVNHWHDDNKGDSAITLATLGLLAPQGVATVASMLPPGDPEFGRAFRHVHAARPDVAFRPSLVPSCGSRTDPATVLLWALRWVPAIVLMAFGVVLPSVRRALDGVSRVVLIGGSNLFDSGQRWPLSTVRLLQVLYPGWAAARLGIPVDVVGHTLGPFKTRSGRRAARTVLEGARVIVLREALSLEAARSLSPAVEALCRVEPDTAFAVPLPDSARQGEILGRYALEGTRYLVLIPRRHPYHAAHETDRVVAEMARAGAEALGRGDVDRLVVLSQVLGPSTIEDDRPVARELAAQLPAEQTVLVQDDFSVEDLVALLEGAAGVLSVRLHGAILAMSAGTPAHAIAYFTAKTAGVLTECGMADRWSEFESFTADRVGDLLDPRHRDEVQRVATRERGRLLALAEGLR